VVDVHDGGHLRWLGGRLKGWDKAKPKGPCRRFVETSGLEVGEREAMVTPHRSGHDPVPREAALDRDATPAPWLGGRAVRFAFT